MTAAEYQQLRAFSSGLARTLLTDSARPVWTKCAWLNPAFVEEESETFDLGDASHAYVLEGQDAFAIIDAPDWRTKAAREARDDARARGKTPLLAHRWADVQGMASVLRAQLAGHPDPVPLTDGVPEHVIQWTDGGVACKARLDWWRHDQRAVDDLKTTSATANPLVWSRVLFNSGYDVQAAFYLRGIKRVYGVEPEFRFVVVETTPPYGASVIALDPEALALADLKVRRAIDQWGECLAKNEWPGYPLRTCYAELPAYELAKWEEVLA